MGDSFTAKNFSLFAFWGVGTGAIYLASYWSEFGLNPFQYIQLQDLFQAGLFGLLLSTASLVLGAVIGHLLAGPVFPSGGGAATPVGLWLNRKKRIFGAINLLAIATIILLSRHSEKWYVVALLSSFFAVGVRDLSVLVAISKIEQVRFVLATFLILIPIVAIGAGKRDALVAASSSSKQVVDLTASVLPAKDALTGDVSYLGRLGDTYVLFEIATFRVVLLDRGSVPQLVVKRRAPAA